MELDPGKAPPPDRVPPPEVRVPPLGAADLILVFGTSLNSCSTSLRLMLGKVRSGVGATVADGRMLFNPATLVSQQRPLSPLSKVHSCPFRLARSAPMHRAGLTHAPVVPAELVQVFGVEVEGDCGKDEEDEEEDEEDDGEDIEGDSRGQVGPHTPQ